MVGIDENFYYEYAMKLGTLAAILKKHHLTEDEEAVLDEAMQIFREKDWERRVLCAELLLKKQMLEKEFGLIEKLMEGGH